MRIVYLVIVNLVLITIGATVAIMNFRTHHTTFAWLDVVVVSMAIAVLAWTLTRRDP